MSLIQEPASYRGVVVEHAVGATSTGLPQFITKLRGLERYDFDDKTWVDWTPREDCEITAYLVLFDKQAKPIFHVKDIQNVFEWDGASLTGLDELDLEGAKVQFEVISDTYDNKTRLKVARIGKYDDVPGSGGVKKLEAAELAKLNTRFAGSLKALSGGPKAASAKGVKNTTTAANCAATNAATIATGKTTSTDPHRLDSTAVAPPPPPPAKTEEAAVADAVAPVAAPVPEKSTKKVTKATKPAAPPAPPKAPAAKQTATEAAPVEKLTYEEAWTKCYEGKLPTVSDEQLATAFTGAMHRIASGQAEGEISPEDWGKIKETVLGECGGS